MKIKLLTIAIALGFGLLSCTNQQTKNEKNTPEKKQNVTHESVKYNIDTENSKANWKGSMIGVYAHEGEIMFKEGSIELTDGNISGGEFVIDMTSMVTTDDDALYKMAPREKLIGHLQSPDFFATEQFPTAGFKIKSVSGNEIIGDLSIRGKVNEEKVSDVRFSVENNSLKASGKLVFDRQKYDVSYENKMNDMVLSDDIELMIEITASR